MADKEIEGITKILECESDLCLDPPSVGADDCGNESHSLACLECQARQINQLFEARIEALVEEMKRELNNILGMCSERSPRWRRVVIALEDLLLNVQSRPHQQ